MNSYKERVEGYRGSFPAMICFDHDGWTMRYYNVNQRQPNPNLPGDVYLCRARCEIPTYREALQLRRETREQRANMAANPNA